MDPNCLTLRPNYWKNFRKKIILQKKTADDKIAKNYAAWNEFSIWINIDKRKESGQAFMVDLLPYICICLTSYNDPCQGKMDS